MNGLKNIFALAAFSVIAGSAIDARAELLLSATDGAHSGSANDSLTPGIAQYSGTIGNFVTSIDIGTGFPGVGSLLHPVLDLTSLDLTTRTRGGTLTLSLTETGFTGTTAATGFISSITGIYAGSHAVMSTYFDTTDAPFGKRTLLASGLADNQSASVLVPPIAGPYSLTAIITVTAGANSLTSIDAGIIDAPEPASAGLLAAGLLALGALCAGRRRTHTVLRARDGAPRGAARENSRDQDRRAGAVYAAHRVCRPDHPARCLPVFHPN